MEGGEEKGEYMSTRRELLKGLLGCAVAPVRPCVAASVVPVIDWGTGTNTRAVSYLALMGKDGKMQLVKYLVVPDRAFHALEVLA